MDVTGGLNVSPSRVLVVATITSAFDATSIFADQTEIASASEVASARRSGNALRNAHLQAEPATQLIRTSPAVGQRGARRRRRGAQDHGKRRRARGNEAARGSVRVSVQDRVPIPVHVTGCIRVPPVQLPRSSSPLIHTSPCIVSAAHNHPPQKEGVDNQNPASSTYLPHEPHIHLNLASAHQSWPQFP